MKKFRVLALALAAVMGMTFTACDKNNGAEGGDTPTPPAATCETAMAVLDIWLSDSALGLLECGFVYTDGTSEELKTVKITAEMTQKGVNSYTPVDTETGYPQPTTLNHYRITLPTISLPGSFKYRFDFSHQAEPDMSYVAENKTTLSFYCEATVTFDNGTVSRKFTPEYKSVRDYTGLQSNPLDFFSTGNTATLGTDATATYVYFAR